MVTIDGMVKHPDSFVIDRLGGNGVVAAMFEISSQAVSKWRKKGIPNGSRMYLELKFPEAFQASPQSMCDGGVTCIGANPVTAAGKTAQATQAEA